MKLIDTAFVVIKSLNILDLGRASPAPAIIHGLGDQPGIVVGLHHALHGGFDARAAFGPLLGLFVAHRPDHDRRMVAMAADHTLELA